MSAPLVILGGGLSGLAAGIRHARFGRPTLILEKHLRPGGLNSYYYRHGLLFETGLHAMTNYASAGARSLPLNRLFRQLKLSRRNFTTHEQIGSEVIFPQTYLRFTNDLSVLREDIQRQFPHCAAEFTEFIEFIRAYDPFQVRPWLSARQTAARFLSDPLLIDMLLWPLMIYGNSQEHDMDMGQFVIMFQALLLEGFFRPGGTIKDLLDMLLEHYLGLGGRIRLRAEVSSLKTRGNGIQTVSLASGEEISCAQVISTIGAPATVGLLPDSLPQRAAAYTGRMSFMESIYIVSGLADLPVKDDCTCIFYNNHQDFDYCRPDSLIDVGMGVINFPANFQGIGTPELAQVRVTHPANYPLWLELNRGAKGGGRSGRYLEAKETCAARSLTEISKIIGNFSENIVYDDVFTPLTIAHYSGKAEGAVYGSPLKIKDGRTNYENLFIAGTDQGYLGIVGAMLSGVTMVNQHILTA
ncbi:MAG: NAD(P)/FAD-dependent oxidoreductase [Deltaproteobacteria bacterium]|nr:NAD(P)/FAD-dependent oxidoreductase [Deltaproteobacteria bacterium]